eukprot:gnl/Trimastix_PCT/1231.p1 GENE.gnl/Trimastix_PCT/1231~~gnl/Trimastix_PCT/1231.p1  ORF type:complete len:1609 (+),score=828.08 gnl/Trimastix_PCT/1231:233-5059(+)
MNPAAQPQRLPMNAAEAACMHPTSKIIAVKAGTTVQLFNLEVQARIKGSNMPEPVEFMKWVALDTLGLVTNNSIYHLTMEGDTQPQRMCARDPQLAGHQIISYRCDPAKKWLLLQGVTVESGTMQGKLQLYSVDKHKSQVLPSHASTVISTMIQGNQATLLALANNTKIHIVELGKEGGGAFNRQCDIFFPQEAANDFPVSMEFIERYGFLAVISAMGFLFLIDVESGTMVSMQRMTNAPVFATTTASKPEDCVLAMTRPGQLIRASVDSSTIIAYISTKLRNLELAIRVASRADLPGADELFREQFERMFQQGNFPEAAKVAATSPMGCLRTSQTIQRFKSVPPVPGQAPPLIQYLGLLLDRSQLNDLESIELVMAVLSQGRKDLVEKWVKDKKLTCSEELGNMVRTHDVKLALAVYFHGECYARVVGVFAELGEFDRILTYAKTVSYTPDYLSLLADVAGRSPDQALAFAQKLMAQPEGALVDAGEVMELFNQRGMVQPLSVLMLDVLKKNDPADSRMQTRFLEILLEKAPQVADALFGKRLYSEYDRNYIAQCAEKAHLYQRALEHYTELSDILRCVANPQYITPEFLVEYCGEIEPEYVLECLKVLLKARQTQTVVNIAKRHSARLGAAQLITLFEQARCNDGLYIFLHGIVDTTEEPAVVLKFVQAAARVQQAKEIERVVKSNNVYDPREVKAFLKETRIDPMPLMIVCDRHGFVDEMTRYLYENNQHKHIETYVTQMSPTNTPIVVGVLLDLDANEDFVRSLLNTVRQLCPIAELVEEVERRNRLKILQSWLEARAQEGNTEAPLHSALAKIYIDLNANAERFLVENEHYDSRVVGLYCEKRDPHLACVAYRRGQCDEELVDVTNRNSLFKTQARYLVERQDAALWATVLTEENSYRRQLIDQVVSTALPQSKHPEEVSATVKAFMNANLPHELIELLEKIMLRRSEFSSNRNLQTLLMITAIRAAPDRVKDYIQRLDNYDGPELAKHAIRAELYQEAFDMYHKFDRHAEAIGVMLDHIKDLARACDYATQINKPEVWTLLANGQLVEGLVDEAIESFIKAGDASSYEQVIWHANQQEAFESLVKYLGMARKQLRESAIDSELCYAYAKTGQLGELEELISGANLAEIQNIGDRCFDEEMYHAARILFNSISNFARLASTLVRLEQYQQAVDAARKANSIKTWKEVCFACVEARAFRLAQLCGVNIVVHADELEELIQFYCARGYFEEIISLLEYGIGLDRAHMGMFTELGVLYSKFKPQKLMEHIKLFHARLNIPQLLRVTEANLQWAELCFLYCHYDEYDYAATTMLSHGADAWNHQQFKEIISKIANMEIYYKSIDFYLAQHPMLLNDLLLVISQRVDNARVVTQLRRADRLPLVKSYLMSVQSNEVPEVNEAINDLLIDEEDCEGLRTSIENYPAFEQTALARRLEHHDLLEMRRVAAWLYKLNKRWNESVELSKRDLLFQDAMETAAESQNPEIAEALLRFFACDVDDKFRAPTFAACLYTCYDILTADVVLELAWSRGLNDYAMPFLINVTREYTSKVDRLVAAQKEEAERRKAQPADSEEDAQATESFQPPGAFPVAPPVFFQGPGMMPPVMNPF